MNNSLSSSILIRSIYAHLVNPSGGCQVDRQLLGVTPRLEAAWTVLTFNVGKASSTLSPPSDRDHGDIFNLKPTMVVPACGRMTR